MDPDAGSLFAQIPEPPLDDELFECLFRRDGVRIERIVSTGHSSAPGAWYDQDDDEWVVLLSGAAGLRIEDEGEDRRLAPGDWVFLPAHCRHRVTWTQAEPATVWLAIHVACDRSASP